MIKVGDNHTITVEKAVKELKFILKVVKYVTTAVEVIIGYEDDTFDSCVIAI